MKHQINNYRKPGFFFADSAKPDPCEPEATNMNITSVLTTGPTVHHLALPKMCGTDDCCCSSPTTFLFYVRMQQLVQSLPVMNLELGQ